MNPGIQAVTSLHHETGDASGRRMGLHYCEDSVGTADSLCRARPFDTRFVLHVAWRI